jgi:hypothetical protein
LAGKPRKEAGMRLRSKLAAVAAAVLTLAGGGVWIAALGAGGASPRPAVTPAAFTAATLAATPAPSPSAEQPDGKETPDAGGEKEPATETSEGPGDTHADPPGQDAGHECPPACDTASGEKP